MKIVQNYDIIIYGLFLYPNNNLFKGDCVMKKTLLFSLVVLGSIGISITTLNKVKTKLEDVKKTSQTITEQKEEKKQRGMVLVMC